MRELLPIATQYGLPGFLIVGVLWVVWKVIDRGIDLSIRIPPKRPPEPRR
jgi:hypothetical protein